MEVFNRSSIGGIADCSPLISCFVQRPAARCFLGCYDGDQQFSSAQFRNRGSGVRTNERTNERARTVRWLCTVRTVAPRSGSTLLYSNALTVARSSRGGVDGCYALAHWLILLVVE